MQQHLNGFDCGAYAIAYATDIKFDRDPASLFYDRQEMRKHLLWYLQRGNLEPYPNSSKRTNHGKSITHRVQLYCHYRMPFFSSHPDIHKGLSMATCAACNEWFHKKCERINALIVKNEGKTKKWNCRNCKKVFFMILLKTLRWVNEWTSHRIPLREFNIKTDYSQRTSTHSFQHKFLMLYEFQDYLLKSINLHVFIYAIYCREIWKRISWIVSLN